MGTSVSGLPGPSPTATHTEGKCPENQREVQEILCLRHLGKESCISHGDPRVGSAILTFLSLDRLFRLHQFSDVRPLKLPPCPCPTSYPFNSIPETPCSRHFKQYYREIYLAVSRLTRLLSYRSLFSAVLAVVEESVARAGCLGSP